MPDLRAQALRILFLLPAVVVGFTLHELCHAGAAVLLGDDTPRKRKRFSLNPLRHLDPIGLVMVLAFGFGWAKPVEYNPSNLKRPAEHSVLIVMAGPLANLVLALLSALALSLLRGAPPWAIELIVNMASLNASLFVFNLVPLPPLDGSHLVFWAIPERFQKARLAFLRYGYWVLAGVLLVSAFANLDPFMIGTMSRALLRFLLGLFGLA